MSSCYCIILLVVQPKMKRWYLARLECDDLIATFLKLGLQQIWYKDILLIVTVSHQCIKVFFIFNNENLGLFIKVRIGNPPQLPVNSAFIYCIFVKWFVKVSLLQNTVSHHSQVYWPIKDYAFVGIFQ